MKSTLMALADFKNLFGFLLLLIMLILGNLAHGA